MRTVFVPSRAQLVSGVPKGSQWTSMNRFDSFHLEQGATGVSKSRDVVLVSQVASTQLRFMAWCNGCGGFGHQTRGSVPRVPSNLLDHTNSCIL